MKYLLLVDATNTQRIFVEREMRSAKDKYIYLSKGIITLCRGVHLLCSFACTCWWRLACWSHIFFFLCPLHARLHLFYAMGIFVVKVCGKLFLLFATFCFWQVSEYVVKFSRLPRAPQFCLHIGAFLWKFARWILLVAITCNKVSLAVMISVSYIKMVGVTIMCSSTLVSIVSLPCILPLQTYRLRIRRFVNVKNSRYPEKR